MFQVIRLVVKVYLNYSVFFICLFLLSENFYVFEMYLENFIFVIEKWNK